MTDDERAALMERIAEALWHRYAPSHHIAWADEPHRTEYTDPAAAILAIAEPAIRADEREACAAIADDIAAFWRLYVERERAEAAEGIAAAIRVSPGPAPVAEHPDDDALDRSIATAFPEAAP